MPHDCPAPEKLTFRSKAAARRYHRQSNFSGKDRLWPYQCPGGSGEHWHLTHQTPQEQAEVAARVAKARGKVGRGSSRIGFSVTALHARGRP